MRKLKLFAFLLGAISLGFTSCTEDEDPVGPSLEFPNDGDKDRTVKANEAVNFTFTVKEGDAKIETVKVTITQSAGEVPLLDTTSVKDGASITVSKAFTVAGTYKFNFVATDKDGLKAEKSVNVIVEATASDMTAFTGEFFHVLSAKKGAYDLVKNEQKGSADASADKDIINTDVVFTGSWKAGNSTSYVKAASTFDYATATKATAKTAFAAGTSATTVASPKAGDVYIAKLRGNDEYAVIKVIAIVDDATASTNKDMQKKLTFSYKK